MIVQHQADDCHWRVMPIEAIELRDELQSAMATLEFLEGYAAVPIRRRGSTAKSIDALKEQ